MSSMRCKVAGCDRDECGVCRRCGSERDVEHHWKDVGRERACFRRKVCARCETEKESPDHDWVPSPNAIGEIELKCGRCGLSI
jgi:hypothetical protein